ncbi:MAG: hypothetical protein NZM12_09700, partial [Steroidobacteraceae bacterium]|nr:hypothetical protein [Steroidobacteraceae bacterium]
MLALLALVGGAPAVQGDDVTDVCAEDYRPAWTTWTADSDTNSLPSLQRGARDFIGYCSGCHSLKYLRWSRLGADLRIPEAQLVALLMPPGLDKNAYITTSLSSADGEAWFGKAPPDLSLIVRAKGADYVYRFLTTFYADPAAASGVNNLALPGTAMPHVLADLQGVQSAVFRNCERTGADRTTVQYAAFEKFETAVPGLLSPEDFRRTVRDIVSFLDYVSDPTQNQRRSLGIWVVLFLLAFTGI